MELAGLSKRKEAPSFRANFNIDINRIAASFRDDLAKTFQLLKHHLSDIPADIFFSIY